jgi:hypothetical protein
MTSRWRQISKGSVLTARPEPVAERGPALCAGRKDRRRLAIPSVLVNGHLFVGSPADTLATYRVR